MTYRIPDPDEIYRAAEHTQIDEIIADAIHRQPVYRKYANTINTAIGELAGIGAVAASVGLDLPPVVTVAIGAVVALGTVLGVYKTKNGITSDMAERLK